MGMKRLLPAALVALAVVVAALAVNLLLVGYAADRSDPVGKLNPRAVLSPTTTGRAPTTTAKTTTEQTTTTSATTTDDHGGDDDRGRNRGSGGGGDDDD